jgi:oxygen-independent coproporphyrinogen-3 oxidase
VPGQSPADWRAELAETVDLAPEHVSAYEHTLEEGTLLAARAAAGRFALADEDSRADMFCATDDVLVPAGIHRYEISNFARPGNECRHNLSGWRSVDLLGVGASAASHVTNTRWTNVADLDEYVRRVDAGEDPTASAEALDEVTWAAEDLYLGLRTTDGVDAAARLARVPSPGRERLATTLVRAAREGRLEGTERVRLTRRGRLLADTLFDALLGT